MSQFTSKKALFRSSRIEKPVTTGITTERLYTQVVMWFDGEELRTAFEFSRENEQPMGEIEVSTDSADVVRLYRQFRLLSELPAINQDSIVGAGGVAAKLHLPQDFGVIAMAMVDNRILNAAQLATDTRKLMGEEIVDKIMTELPPDLEQLLKTLIDGGYMLHVGSLNEEVASGRLAPTDFLRRWGIDTPEALDERDKKAAAMAERFRPVVQKVLGGVHQHAKGCTCFERAQQFAAECVLKGLTEEVDVVGMTLLKHYQENARNPFAVLFGLPESMAREALIARTAATLAERLPEANRTEAQHRERLAKLREEWHTMPLVTL